MKRLIFVLALLCIACRLDAQTLNTTITTAGSDCSVSTRCAVFNPTTGNNTMFITLSGTFTGTVAFEFAAPGAPTTFRALSVVNLVSFSGVTTATATGAFSVVNPGYSTIRVRASSLMSGSVGVTIRAINNNALVGVIFGGAGGTTIGTVNQGDAGAAAWLVNCTSGCSGGTSDTDDGSVASGQSTGLSIPLNYMYNGSAWVRETGDASNGLDVDVTRLPSLPAGTNNIGDVDVLTLPALPTGANTIGSISNVSGVISLPTGASTAALQTTGNTSLASIASTLSSATTADTPFLANGLTDTVTTVRNAAGVLSSYYCYNPTMAVAYVQIFDISGSVTLGMSTPKWSIGIPAGGGANLSNANLNFANAIKVASTTTATGSTGAAIDCNFGSR